jgi:DNA-binding transcriptional LysR family regulator
MPEPSRNYFKEMRLQQLRGLVALARWQTFSAAAAALRLSRTSVWQQVRALEQELACTLLRVRGHRVELTAEGQKLVEIAAPLLAGFDSIKSVFPSLLQELQQTLVIATAPTFLIYELRGPISQIHVLYPKLHLSFLERNSPTALEILEQGGADLAVVAVPEKLTRRTSLEYTRLTAYPFTLICPPGHALLVKKQLTLRDLTRHPLILSGNVTYCRQHFDAVLGQAGLLDKLKVVLESNFPVMHFEYVRMGMGVALAPLPPALSSEPESPLPGVVLRNVAHLFGEEPLFYVRRKGEFETPFAARFREIVTQNAPR